MKSFNLFVSVAMATIIGTTSFAQDKKEMKELEKNYGAFTGHKKIFDQEAWALCKFSVVYKLSSAMTAAAMDKANYGSAQKAKVKTSSGAYAVLDGLTEEDLQEITNNLGKRFQDRMKSEVGVSVMSWSEFESDENTKKLKESAEDQELYSKSQGLAYAMTYDGAPHYNRVLVTIPGGKKLAKSQKSAVSEITLIFDFAEMLAKAEAKVKYGGSTSTTVTYNLLENTEQEMAPGVRLTPKMGSQATLEAATDIQGTGIKAQDQSGYMFYLGLPYDIVSRENYVLDVKVAEDEVPAILANRRNNKIENAKTWYVTTTPELYEKAVLDAFNQYMDDVLKIYKYHKG